MLQIICWISLIFATLTQGQDESCTHVADVVFVSDHSGSIDSGEFDDLKDYLVAVTKKLDVGPDTVHVGSVWFGTSAGVDFPLDQYTRQRDVTNAIRAISQHGGYTNIEAGIETAQNIVGLRPYTNVNPIERTMILITDGRENSGSDARKAASFARLDHWNLIAVGVGGGVDRNLLNEISEGSAYFVDNYAGLSTLVDIVDGLECVLLCDAPFIANSNAAICDNTEAGHNCEFECDHGFKVSTRNSNAYCGEDGLWQTLPTCIEVPTCSGPSIEFSNADEKCTGTVAGDVCFFDCYEDYETDMPVIRCDDVGNWALPMPTCTPLEVAGEFSPETVEFDKDIFQDIMSGALFEELRNVMTEIMFGTVTDKEDVAIKNEFAIIDPYNWGIPYQHVDYTPVNSGNGSEESGEGGVDDDVVCEDHPDFAGSPDDCGGCPCFSYCPGNENADYCEDYDPVLDMTAFEACPVCCGVCEESLKLLEDVENIRLLQDVEVESFHKINVLDRQPFNDDNSVYDAYKLIVQTAMVPPPVVDQNELNTVNTEIARVEGEILAVENLFYNDPNSPFATLEEFLEGSFYGRKHDSLVTEYNYWLGRKAILFRDPVASMNDRIDDDKVLTDNGNMYPNWYATPTPEDIMALFDRSRNMKATYDYDITREQVRQQNYVADKTAFYAAYKGGNFVTVSFQEETMETHVSLEFNKWARVYVRPGDWYDSTWDIVIGLPNKLSPGWCLNSEDCPAGHEAVYGPNGALNSVISQMIVVQDVRIRAVINATMAYELNTIYEEAEGMRFGNMCTGKGCVSSVNVIVGLDGAPTATDRTYLKTMVKYLQGSSFRAKSTPNTIAILGSSLDLNATPNNAGGAMHEVASSLGLEARYYNSVEEIERFFEDLRNEAESPQIIWIPGNKAVNSLSAEEGAVLASNHRTLQEYATEGGAILAHGSGDTSYEWLLALLPGLTIEQGCDSSDVHITAGGKDWLPAEVTEEMVEGVPCYDHFEGPKGNLDPLVTDLHDRVYVMGGYGGFTTNSNPHLATGGTGNVFFESDATTNGYAIVADLVYDVPMILAVYAPRIP